MIKKESYFFGFLFLGYGTTISRTPLLNIQVSGKNIPVEVLEIYFQGHLEDSGKYGTFICRRFGYS